MTQQQPTQTAHPVEPAPAPRPLTPAVRRRAWTEPRVRAWGLLTLALLVVAIGLIVQQLRVRQREAWLLEHGLSINAEVNSIEGVYLKGKHYSPDTPVELKFETPDGKEHKVIGVLDGRSTDILIGETVPIRVDPDDPEHWTAGLQPTPIGTLLIGMVVPIPAVLLVAAVTAYRRRKLLRVWESGESAEMVALETRHSALAPKSTLVRCTPASGQDSRVVSVYVPRSVAQGEAVWVLFPPGRIDRAVSAEWFA